ncbi:hypothetical protein PI124_g21103 [Phytophthora idaei]|nr:hypothetical protein PI125_g22687 [Phytophthora idaei]KAG3130720.1 hypothetical protein PI126_g20373 [Phytophthora idaei]KAG3233824.1 hypothetical protein PI124_g21103 [Phytophthora idaei]
MKQEQLWPTVTLVATPLRVSFTLAESGRWSTCWALRWRCWAWWLSPGMMRGVVEGTTLGRCHVTPAQETLRVLVAMVGWVVEPLAAAASTNLN